MPLLVNKVARCIDIRHKDQRYRLLPAGKPVDVPAEAASLPFTKALLKSGDVGVVTKGGADADPDAEAEAKAKAEAEAKAKAEAEAKAKAEAEAKAKAEAEAKAKGK